MIEKRYDLYCSSETLIMLRSTMSRLHLAVSCLRAIAVFGPNHVQDEQSWRSLFSPEGDLGKTLYASWYEETFHDLLPEFRELIVEETRPRLTSKIRKSLERRETIAHALDFIVRFPVWFELVLKHYPWLAEASPVKNSSYRITLRLLSDKAWSWQEAIAIHKHSRHPRPLDLSVVPNELSFVRISSRGIYLFLWSASAAELQEVADLVRGCGIELPKV